jgi:hypothetical protein
MSWLSKAAVPDQVPDKAMRYHTTEPPPPPRSIRPELPVLLEKTIMLALEKDPALRPPDAGSLLKGLKAVAASAR